MQCTYCERRCDIEDQGTGVCRMYTVSGGVLTERFPYSWSFCGALPIEGTPFYHVYPGIRCLVLGTAGCNFRCRYCSNAAIAKEDPETLQGGMYRLSPAKIVEMALKTDCRSIVFNVNEPTVSLLSLLEVGREAQARNIPMGCLTNGYATVYGTELLASIFSFFNVSLKGLAPGFTGPCIGIDSSEPVLRNIRRLARDRHVEVTTPVIEGVNDIELEAMADFIADVDPEIPWHVFRLLPEDEMKDARYPDVGAIDRSLQSIRKRLPYVYFHNFVGSPWVDTFCPACGRNVIERYSLGCGGDKLKRVLCRNGRCPDCGHEIRLFGEDTSFGKREGVWQ